MNRVAALGPCSGQPRLAPKSLGQAENSPLSRPPIWAAPPPRLSIGGCAWAAVLPLWILISLIVPI